MKPIVLLIIFQVHKRPKWCSFMSFYSGRINFLGINSSLFYFTHHLPYYRLKRWIGNHFSDFIMVFKWKRPRELQEWEMMGHIALNRILWEVWNPSVNHVCPKLDKQRTKVSERMQFTAPSRSCNIQMTWSIAVHASILQCVPRSVWGSTVLCIKWMTHAAN